MKVAEYEKKRFKANQYVEGKNKEIDQNGYRAYGEGIKDTEKRVKVFKA